MSFWSNMKHFEFSKDIISFFSVAISFIAFIATIILPEIFNKYFVPMVIILFLVLFIYIINYLKRTLEEHETEISKINEKINIYKDISYLKAKIESLENNKMGKRGQGAFIEIFIKLIQIGAIIFAGYIILKALGVI